MMTIEQRIQSAALRVASYRDREFYSKRKAAGNQMSLWGDEEEKQHPRNDAGEFKKKEESSVILSQSDSVKPSVAETKPEVKEETKMTTQTRHFISGNTYPVKEKLKALGCRWDGDRKAWYTDDDQVAQKANALVPGNEIYNSPPPSDLGTADPVESAKKHGRVAVSGAKVRSFQGEGRAAQPDGTIFEEQGKRYVQLAHTKPRYLSADYLEDMDMFSMSAGHYYQIDAVEVEPTGKEAADDAERKKKKDEIATQKAVEAENKAKSENEQKAAWENAIEGLVLSTAPPVGMQKTGDHLRISDKETAEKFTLPNGDVGWERNFVGYDDYRTYWHIPQSAAQSAAISWAKEVGITPEDADEFLKKYSGCHGADRYKAIANADDKTKQELRDAASEREKAEDAKKKDLETRLAKNHAATEQASKALGITPTYRLNAKYEHNQVVSVDAKFDSREAAAKAPDSITITGDFPSFDVKVNKILPDRHIIVKCAVGKGDYQFMKLDTERNEFTQVWALNAKPAGDPAVYRPTGLDGDANDAYKAARKKAGNGELKAFKKED